MTYFSSEGNNALLDCVHLLVSTILLTVSNTHALKGHWIRFAPSFDKNIWFYVIFLHFLFENMQRKLKDKKFWEKSSHHLCFYHVFFTRASFSMILDLILSLLLLHMQCNSPTRCSLYIYRQNASESFCDAPHLILVDIFFFIFMSVASNYLKVCYQLFFLCWMNDLLPHYQGHLDQWITLKSNNRTSTMTKLWTTMLSLQSEF